MRNMSFALTTEQFLARTKTVTRRLGWANLNPGDVVMGVKKAMGLKPGEKIERLGPIEIVDVRRECLYDDLTDEDVAREGFPDWDAEQFAAHFVKCMGCNLYAEVTRIEFKPLFGSIRTPNDWLGRFVELRADLGPDEVLPGSRGRVCSIAGETLRVTGYWQKERNPFETAGPCHMWQDHVLYECKQSDVRLLEPSEI